MNDLTSPYKLTARQREIIDRALELLAELGARRFTMKRLAEKIGVTEAALYRHFASKNDLLLAIVHDFESSARNELENGLPPGLQGIAAFITSRLDRVAERPALARALFTEELFDESQECADALRQMFKKHRARLIGLFQEAKTNGEIRDDLANETLFTIVFGSVRQLVKEWTRSNGAFSLLKRRDMLLDAFRKILRPR